MGFFPNSSTAVAAPLNLKSTSTNTVFGAATTGDTANRIEMDADGGLRFGSGAAPVDTTLSRLSANVLLTSGAINIQGNTDISTIGRGLQVAEGTNAKQGTFALSGAATTVVNNSTITANSRIFMQCQALGTVASASTLAVTARSAGVSFTVTPSQATDTSTIAFEIFEPG